jgi:hypothetical protein
MVASRVDSETATQPAYAAPIVLLPGLVQPPPPPQHQALRRNADILREREQAEAAAAAAAATPPPVLTSAAPTHVSRFDMPLALSMPTTSASPSKVLHPSATALAMGSGTGAAPSQPAGSKRKQASPSPRIRKPRAPGSATRAKKGTPESAAAAASAESGSPEKKRPKLPPQSLNATFSGSAQPMIGTPATPAAAGRPRTPPQQPPSPYAALQHPSSPLRAIQPNATSTLSPLGNSASGLAHAATAAHAAPLERMMSVSDALGSKGKDIKSYFGARPTQARFSSMQVDHEGAMTDTASHVASQSQQTLPAGMDTDSDSEVQIIGEGNDAPRTGAAVSGNGDPSSNSSTPSHVKKERPATATTPTPTPAAAVAAVVAPGLTATGKKKAEPKPRKKKGEAAAAAAAASASALGAAQAAAASSSAAAAASAAMAAIPLGAGVSPEAIAQFQLQQQRCREWEQALQVREQQCAEREQALQKRIDSTGTSVQRVAGLENDLARLTAEGDSYRQRIQGIMHTLFIELSQLRTQRTEEKLIRDSLSIGRLVPSYNDGLFGGGAGRDIWEDGEMIREIDAKLMSLNREKAELESTKKRITRQKASLNRAAKAKAEHKDAGGAAAASSFPNSMGSSIHSVGASAAASSAAPAASSARPSSAAAGGASDMDAEDEHDDSANGGFAKPSPVDEVALREADEVASVRLLLLKQSLAEWEEKKAQFELTKKTLSRTQRLQTEQRHSVYKHNPLLSNRYVVLHLLGKGGFSEVHKAFDLVELRYVACKIHQLNPQWPASRKVSRILDEGRETWTVECDRAHALSVHCCVADLFEGAIHQARHARVQHS